MPEPKQNLKIQQLCKTKAPKARNYKGTRAIKLLPRATTTDPLSYTATTIRPTSRSISICSYHKLIIVKEKSKQGHPQKGKGELIMK